MDKKKDYTGFPGDCSEVQLAALAEFRKIVTKMGLADPPYDDAYLLRFLRARKFDLKKTEKMWVDFIEWRKQNGVDIINTYVYSEIEEVRKYYPHGYHKTDKEGRPVYIERIGSLNLKKLFQVTTEERLIKYYIQSYEILLKKIFPGCTAAKGKRVDQTFTILDLTGVSLTSIGKQVYNFIQLASKIGQDNYPEILGKMYIINAPFLFSGIWAIVKPWLDEKTRNKIHIKGSGYQKELLEAIDAENLPDFLGGKCKCGGDCLSLNIGPWNPTGQEKMFGVLNDANQKATIELDGQLNKLNINERSEALVSKEEKKVDE